MRRMTMIMLLAVSRRQAAVTAGGKLTDELTSRRLKACLHATSLEKTAGGKRAGHLSTLPRAQQAATAPRACLQQRVVQADSRPKAASCPELAIRRDALSTLCAAWLTTLAAPCPSWAMQQPPLLDCSAASGWEEILGSGGEKALTQARELYGAGRLQEAETFLERVASCIAEDGMLGSGRARAALLKLLGDVRVDKFEFERAIPAYTSALEAVPNESDNPIAPGAYFGRANAREGLRQYTAAIDDYTASLALKVDVMPLFERAQALKEERRWAEAVKDYTAAANLFNGARKKREAKIAEAQAAFAQFELGEVAAACGALQTLSRQLYSSDVRAALAACYWRLNEKALAEDTWLDACAMDSAMCRRYPDKEWLLSYRKWTPRLADSMSDFLALRALSDVSRLGTRVLEQRR
eukprot:gnl/TRDRNA2_/TRDRNA2_169197_c0_seq1.p1 gnl/TRDRNA2_/TRDRNA2_169197_c0~~gnl/TRDRNA2_/TRDRNA2_169197_c0_seq1.p1  ORF type:complete len:411 (-),score=66.59 gnl/TRDRNA2_/TRDRNA2_169197_c0_seq1:96-1328(-)